MSIHLFLIYCALANSIIILLKGNPTTIIAIAIISIAVVVINELIAHC